MANAQTIKGSCGMYSDRIHYRNLSYEPANNLLVIGGIEKDPSTTVPVVLVFS